MGRGLTAIRHGVQGTQARGGRTLLTSCVPGPGSPQPFYERIGFAWLARVGTAAP